VSLPEFSRIQDYDAEQSHLEPLYIALMAAGALLNTVICLGGCCYVKRRVASVRRRSKLRIPTSKDVLGTQGLDDVTALCAQCQGGHGKWECPARFAAAFRAPLPGYTADGARDPAAWLPGDEPAPATLTALRAYFRRHGVQAGPRGAPAFVHQGEECALEGAAPGPGAPGEHGRGERRLGAARGLDEEAGGGGDGGDGDMDGAEHGEGSEAGPAHSNGHGAHGHGAHGPGAHGHGAHGHGAHGHGAHGNGAHGNGAHGHGAHGHGAHGHEAHSHPQAHAAGRAASFGGRKAKAAGAAHGGPEHGGPANGGQPHGSGGGAAPQAPPPAATTTGLVAALQQAIAAAVSSCTRRPGPDPAAAARGGLFTSRRPPSPLAAV
jgi:hypothetical protein